MPIRCRSVAICAAVIAVASSMFAGCVSTPESPSLEITSPQNGMMMSSGDITVRVNVNHFRTVDKQGEANVDGEGHLHFFMDVDTVPGTPGQPAVPADANATWAQISVTSHTFYHVTAGTHTFAVQLVNNDHTPLIPVVADSVTVVAS